MRDTSSPTARAAPSRRTVVAAAGAAALTTALPQPQAAAQTRTAELAANPGFHRFAVGSLDVVMLHEGTSVRDMPADFLRNADTAAYGRVQAELGLPANRLLSSFTVPLVRAGGRLVLFDTGFADNGPPGTGRLAANLAAAGVRPADIDTVVISHFHGDHISGVRRRDGTLAFPNAEILVPEPEWAHFMDDARMAAVPEAARGAFTGARRAFGADAGRVRRFAWDAEIVPGVTALRADGHTPGHTVFLVASGNEQLLLLADLTANPHVFVRRPEWQTMFDSDGAAAVATRRRILDRAAADRIRVAFYHGAFPSTGFVVADGGAYDLVPAMWM